MIKKISQLKIIKIILIFFMLISNENFHTKFLNSFLKNFLLFINKKINFIKFKNKFIKYK